MLISDMGIYYDFTPDPDSLNFPYYPQGNNKFLKSRENPGDHPIAYKRARQAWNYAKDNSLFQDDLTKAFVKLLTVPS